MPPDIQSLGTSTQAQSIKMTYSKLSDANKEIVLSTLGVLIDGLLAQQS
jgi:hypothetical protein